MKGIEYNRKVIIAFQLTIYSQLIVYNLFRFLIKTENANI